MHVPDFRGADIIVYELLNHKDITPVLVEDVMRQQKLVNVRARPLQDEASVFADDVVQL